MIDSLIYNNRNIIYKNIIINLILYIKNPDVYMILEYLI